MKSVLWFNLHKSALFFCQRALTHHCSASHFSMQPANFRRGLRPTHCIDRSSKRPFPVASLTGYPATLVSSPLHWSRPGSNRQPLACKASALPIELRPRSPAFAGQTVPIPGNPKTAARTAKRKQPTRLRTLSRSQALSPPSTASRSTGTLPQAESTNPDASSRHPSGPLPTGPGWSRTSDLVVISDAL